MSKCLCLSYLLDQAPTIPLTTWISSMTPTWSLSSWSSSTTSGTSYQSSWRTSIPSSQSFLSINWKYRWCVTLATSSPGLRKPIDRCSTTSTSKPCYILLRTNTARLREVYSDKSEEVSLWRRCSLTLFQRCIGPSWDMWGPSSSLANQRLG